MVFDQDWLFASDQYVCGLRTAGVLIRNGKLLVQRDRDGDEYALPGGHVKVGETLECALVREYKEETGADIVVTRLLWSEECFWEHAGKQAHGIAFYFLIEERAGCAIPDKGAFAAQRDCRDVVMGWLGLDEIGDVVLYPEFLKTEIGDLSGERKHFVTVG